MKTRLPGAAIITMVLLASPVLAAPTLQQVGEPTATEVVMYTGSSEAVVRQETDVRLARRANTVSFEWASDSVDASSIRLHGDPALTVGEVLRPTGDDRLLRWSVDAPATGDYALTASFLLSGLKWSADYQLDWSPGNDTARLSGWLSVKNETGMDLDGLRARFVLGNPGAGAEQQATFELRDLRELAAGASARTAFFPTTEVPVRTIHRIDSEADAERVQRLIEITPPAAGPLARTSLPSGPMTIVTPTDVPPASMRDARLSYEPSESFEIDLGIERDVVVERRLTERRKTALEFDRLGKVSGFDTVESYRIEVRNRTDEPIEIELVETVLETWEMKTDAVHVLEDGQAFMPLGVPADGEDSIEFTLVKHSGTRVP
ncbi:MAG: hypothetical protein ACLFU7_07590 [Armatimonadota bacterium]